MEPYQTQKMQYIKVLLDYCGISDKDEFSLHHEYSEAIAAHDLQHVKNIKAFVNQWNSLQTKVQMMISEILQLKK